MATHGLSKPGWTMPTLTSDAVHGTSNGTEKEKEHDDSTSGDADAAKSGDPEAGLPMSDVSISDSEVIDPSEQAGVRKVEAVTLTWSKRSLYLIYIKCVKPIHRFCMS